ncbi:MAG: gfo/Idh/MocA family oxidoreductase [Planctomycetota bacterium]|nr:MAG: gfo/Idh/MocA family oxidoreductase [Planctomycetota bacterium]
MRPAATDRPTPARSSTNRRTFLKSCGAAATTAALAHRLAPAAYAAGSDIIRVGLVGCGGRGTGAAAQALNADPGVRLVAMGDTFKDRLQSSLNNLRQQAAKDRVLVDDDHQFVGFDAYKHVIDAVDVVLLATPPHFRPQHLRYAVEQGKHAFVEKPVAVDGPGVRKMFDIVELARQKKLTIVSGLCWRYHYGMRATFEQIHSGTIGEITAMQCSYNTRGLWVRKRQPEWSDMEWQIRNWLYFTWLSGDHIVEQHVHSLDKTLWAMQDQPPVRCSGTGGRQVRTAPEYGHIYDHFAIVYEYPNGMKIFSRCRQQNGCAVDVSDHVFGTKGRVDVFRHTIYDWKGNVIWKYRGSKNNMYQTEHDELFAAIRKGETINNGDYMTKSTLMAIMGRMAAYTGQNITWEQALNSQQDLSPPEYDWIDLPVPPVAMPGITPFV